MHESNRATNFQLLHFRLMKALELIANSSSIEIQDLIMTNDGLTNCLSNVNNINLQELIIKFMNGGMEDMLNIFEDSHTLGTHDIST